jgi:hypothetical protein
MSCINTGTSKEFVESRRGNIEVSIESSRSRTALIDYSDMNSVARRVVSQSDALTTGRVVPTSIRESRNIREHITNVTVPELSHNTIGSVTASNSGKTVALVVVVVCAVPVSSGY